jgi:exo-beta-1,3-glucanase (GH17 family)
MSDRRKSVKGTRVLNPGTIALLSLILTSCQPAKSRYPFFAYLVDSSSRAALIAFSPTHHDPRPGKDHLVPSRQSISDDLQALRPAFDGLILYGYDKDVTPTILEEANRLHYRAILLGIWDPRADDEIGGTIQLIRQYQHGLALAVCVGNEGIAFDRYTLSEVQTATESLRKRLGGDAAVPICTSEPLVQYVDGPLRGLGDFLCPNIHFVFEHPEKSPAKAASWVHGLAEALAQTAHKSVLVKETGMPHGSDDRFTPEAQREFWAAYLHDKTATHETVKGGYWVSYAAAFEAFDQRWKAEQSKMPVEAEWGLLGPDRKPYPVFSVCREFLSAVAK